MTMQCNRCLSAAQSTTAQERSIFLKCFKGSQKLSRWKWNCLFFFCHAWGNGWFTVSRTSSGLIRVFPVDSIWLL